MGCFYSNAMHTNPTKFVVSGYKKQDFSKHLHCSIILAFHSPELQNMVVSFQC